MVVLLLASFLFLIYLVHERVLLNRRLSSIPLRICVTGTRGKSGVVRMLASVLREDGRCVLAKTTGSQALFLLPDGEEVDVPRRGLPSIIEQKRLVKKASDVRADVLVAEVMSIHPENHYVESQRILRPDLVVMTNVRRDHTDAMGKTEEEIASVLCLDIPPRARVFVPESENRPVFEAACQSNGGELVPVPQNYSLSLQQKAPQLKQKAFREQLDLVCAVSGSLRIDDDVVLRGLQKATGDIGALRIWRHRIQEDGKTVFLVNAFAANDPESTFRVVKKVKERVSPGDKQIVGLLNLRWDRGDRTQQWIDVLRGKGSEWFHRLYVTGGHARIVGRKLRRAVVLKGKSPKKMMEMILSEMEDDAILIGLGNIKGLGEQLVAHWREAGEAYGI